MRFRELGLADAPLPADLVDLLVREPRLLRRPIVSDGRRAVVGFDRALLAAAFAPAPPGA